MDKKGNTNTASAADKKLTIGELLVCVGIIIVLLGCGFGYYMGFNGNLLYTLIALVATLGATIGLAYLVTYTKKQKNFATRWRILRYGAIVAYIVVAAISINFGINKTGVILSGREQLRNAYVEDCAAIRSSIDDFIEMEKVAITDMTNGVANHSTFYFKAADTKSQETFKAWGLNVGGSYNSNDFYKLSAKLKGSKEKSLKDVADFMGQYYNPGHENYDTRLRYIDQAIASPLPIQLPAVTDNLKAVAMDVKKAMKDRHDYLHLYSMEESDGNFSLKQVAFDEYDPLGESKFEKILTGTSGFSLWAILLGILAFLLIILPSLVARSVNNTYNGRTPKGGFPI